MISKFIRLEVCRDIAFGFSFSWLGLRVGGHCWLGLRVGGHCLEWLAVGLSRFLIYLALSPHLIIWSCEAVCPYGSRVCHGLPNRLWVAWVSRFKCRYLDTQLWQCAATTLVREVIPVQPPPLITKFQISRSALEHLVKWYRCCQWHKCPTVS